MKKPMIALLVACFALCCLVATAADPKAESFDDVKAKAEKGDVEAQAHLGWLYDIGAGVPQDRVAATVWLRKAAEHGLPSAQWSLGSRAWKGQGMDKDLIEAAKWLKLAALVGYEEKYANAAVNLGEVIREMTPDQKMQAGVDKLVYLPPPRPKEGAPFSISDRKLLEGLAGVSIKIDVDGETSIAIKERIQTIIELHLRTAGIKIIPTPSLGPTFVLRLNSLHYKQGVTFLSVNGSLEDSGFYNKMWIINLQIWRRDIQYIVGDDLFEKSAVDKTEAIVDQFANDYLTANPR